MVRFSIIMLSATPNKPIWSSVGLSMTISLMANWFPSKWPLNGLAKSPIGNHPFPAYPSDEAKESYPVLLESKSAVS